MQNDDIYNDEWSPESPLTPNGRFPSDMPEMNWLDSIRSLWQWDDMAAEISQESLARVALVGLPHAGKKLLFNRLRGWDSATKGEEPKSEGVEPSSITGPTFPENEWVLPIQVESFGFFLLADLPSAQPAAVTTAESLMLQLSDPALIVYLLDATMGVRPADYRWIATLRAAGKPILVAFNKADTVQRLETAVSEATTRLGMPVIPISAMSGLNVEDQLLSAMLDAAPRLAVPLGRELLCLRRTAARRVMRQAAVAAGMFGAQPIPLVDLPIQASLQVGLVMRIGAAFGHTPTGGFNRELLTTIVSSLGLRYLGVSLIKLVPILGWAVSGIFSSVTTLLIGEAAMRYYEAGGTIPFRQWLNQWKK